MTKNELDKQTLKYRTKLNTNTNHLLLEMVKAIKENTDAIEFKKFTHTIGGLEQEIITREILLKQTYGDDYVIDANDIDLMEKHYENMKRFLTFLTDEKELMMGKVAEHIYFGYDEKFTKYTNIDYSAWSKEEKLSVRIPLDATSKQWKEHFQSLDNILQNPLLDNRIVEEQFVYEWDSLRRNTLARKILPIEVKFSFGANANLPRAKQVQILTNLKDFLDKEIDEALNDPVLTTRGPLKLNGEERVIIYLKPEHYYGKFNTKEKLYLSIMDRDGKLNTQTFKNKLWVWLSRKRIKN